MSKLDLAIKNGNASEALRLGGEEARAAANHSDDVRQVNAIPEECLCHALASAIENGNAGQAKLIAERLGLDGEEARAAANRMDDVAGMRAEFQGTQALRAAGTLDNNPDVLQRIPLMSLRTLDTLE